jgi:hypothetical protein
LTASEAQLDPSLNSSGDSSDSSSIPPGNSSLTCSSLNHPSLYLPLQPLQPPHFPPTKLKIDLEKARAMSQKILFVQFVKSPAQQKKEDE